jgi:hypothetical protein
MVKAANCLTSHTQRAFRDLGRGEQNPKNGRIAFKSGIHELLSFRGNRSQPIQRKDS